MADFERACAALVLDDAETFAAAIESGPLPASLNKQVARGKIGGAAPPSACEVKEGDTFLHIAFRNQKWRIKTKCVLLGVDPRLKNAEGETGPAMQLAQSLPRFAMCVCLLFLFIRPPAFLADSVGPGGRNVTGLLTAVAGVDLLLALRWWCYANVFDPGAAYVKDLKAARNAKKATRKRA